MFFNLRTTREEVLTTKRLIPRPSVPQAQPIPARTSESSPTNTNGNDVPMADGTSSQASTVSTDSFQTAVTQNGQQFIVDPSAVHRPTWDCVEELVQNLKTSFPLLILNLETLVDQIISRFKPTHEEDIYRHICMLLQDALSVRCFCDADVIPKLIVSQSTIWFARIKPKTMVNSLPQLSPTCIVCLKESLSPRSRYDFDLLIQVVIC